jgi:hypothetical protein
VRAERRERERRARMERIPELDDKEVEILGGV